MKEVWFHRVNNALLATDEDSRKVIERMAQGECKAFRPLGIRCTIDHRRYWAMMTVIAKNVKRIEIDRLGKQPVYMPIFDKDNAHTAMKLCTGLYDTLPVGGTDYCVRVPKSTNFEEMTAEEWAAYWPRVMDVIVETVAPEIRDDGVRADVLRSIENWQAEAA